MTSRNGYGTLPQEAPIPSDVEMERAAMLSKPSRKDAFASRCAAYMNVNVTKSWGDLALLGCYIITGLLDSTSIMVWGSFVSMQTGKPQQVTFRAASMANPAGQGTRSISAWESLHLMRTTDGFALSSLSLASV